MNMIDSDMNIMMTTGMNNSGNMMNTWDMMSWMMQSGMNNTGMVQSGVMMNTGSNTQPVGMMMKQETKNPESTPVKNTTTTTIKTQTIPPGADVSQKRNITKDTSKLTPLQLQVTMYRGTEQPYQNAYWNTKEKGIYVDIIDGTALFSSTDKYDSQTWRPSFTKPINSNAVKYEFDNSAGETRVEVASTSSNAHLWHRFNDGPTDKGGKRFCMNSASLRFIPYEKMEAAGYGKYLSLFE